MALQLVLVAMVIWMRLEEGRAQLSGLMPDVDWSYFPNGDGVPQLIFLNTSGGPVTRVNYEKDITFHLYTRETPNGNNILVDDIEMLKAAKFSPGKPTKFIVHGWQSYAKSKSIQNIKHAYLVSRDCNVITVDWKDLSSSIFYIGPVSNTRPVGTYIGQMIRFLIDQGSTMELMHIVGHSLGAHVAGFAGASLAPERIARITGLDPARPGFPQDAGVEHHLDPGDAQLVVVIHTCGGSLGIAAPSGHVDFYPNGGLPSQPGCCCFPLFAESCSHSRSHEFFAESLTSSKGFRAVKCDSWSNFKKGTCRQANQREIVYMGDHENYRAGANGIYYLETDMTAPYALG